MVILYCYEKIIIIKSEVFLILRREHDNAQKYSVKFSCKVCIATLELSLEDNI